MYGLHLPYSFCSILLCDKVIQSNLINISSLFQIIYKYINSKSIYLVHVWKKARDCIEDQFTSIYEGRLNSSEPYPFEMCLTATPKRNKTIHYLLYSSKMDSMTPQQVVCLLKATSYVNIFFGCILNFVWCNSTAFSSN